VPAIRLTDGGNILRMSYLSLITLMGRPWGKPGDGADTSSGWCTNVTIEVIKNNRHGVID